MLGLTQVGWPRLADLRTRIGPEFPSYVYVDLWGLTSPKRWLKQGVRFENGIHLGHSIL
jgi:hypothetical protein